MKKSYVFIIGIIILSFIISVYFYPQMPEKMASHWNASGEVDGYMPKFWGLFLMPIFSIGLFLLFIGIPKIDPLKNNIKKFRKYFDNFVVLIMLFLFYIHLIIILWSLGIRYEMFIMLIPAMAGLFYYSGILMENAKRNWFIGIRTPWTLSSDKIWDKTNKLGGKLFKISAVISLFGMFFGDYGIYFVIGPVLLSAVYVIVYSYFEFQKK